MRPGSMGLFSVLSVVGVMLDVVSEVCDARVHGAQMFLFNVWLEAYFQCEIMLTLAII